MTLDAAPRSRLSLEQASIQLGVHYQTAYRWVRQGRLRAWKIGGVYALDPRDVAALAAHRLAPVQPPTRRHVREWGAFADRLFHHLQAGDEVAARDLAEGLVADGLGLAEVGDGVLVPALFRVGEEWAAGRVGIAAEHRASGICERIVCRLSPMPPGRPRGVAVVCSPPGDEHRLPGQMATAALRADHWQVDHLGIGVPESELVRLLDAEQPGLVVISVTWPPDGDAAAVLALRLAAPGRRILAGRPGLSLAELVARARSASGR